MTRTTVTLVAIACDAPGCTKQELTVKTPNGWFVLSRGEAPETVLHFCSAGHLAGWAVGQPDASTGEAETLSVPVTATTTEEAPDPMAISLSALSYPPLTEEMTCRERVVTYVRWHEQRYGYSPDPRDVAARIDRATSSVYAWMKRLREDGTLGMPIPVPETVTTGPDATVHAAVASNY